MCARRLLDRVKLFPHSSQRCDPISTTQKQRQRLVKSNFRLAASAKRNTWSMRPNISDSVDFPSAVAEVVRAGAKNLNQLLGELNRSSEHLHWFLFSGDAELCPARAHGAGYTHLIREADDKIEGETECAAAETAQFKSIKDAASSKIGYTWEMNGG